MKKKKKKPQLGKGFMVPFIVAPTSLENNTIFKEFEEKLIESLKTKPKKL